MTNDEAVQLAERMRAAGVQKFSFSGLSCELLPPAPTPLADLAARVGELPAGERQKLLDTAKKELEEDLYGAARG